MAGKRRTGTHRAARGGARRGTPRRHPLAVLGSAGVVTAALAAGAVGMLPDDLREVELTESVGAAEPRADVPVAGAPPRTPVVAVPETPAPLATEGEVAAVSDSTALPEGSGRGRRVVFSEARQRVWLVGADGAVERTYLVSGSIYDNLDPGRYRVFSRSRDAVGIDDSGTMEYFVRFTYGDEGAAIGFHTIPVDDGRPVQSAAQLGTPLSHGCVRQRRSDAVALWEFAPIGTRVVVTA